MPRLTLVDGGGPRSRTGLRVIGIITGSRGTPGGCPEWLQVMVDPLLAQSAIDRLQSAAYVAHDQ